MVTDVPDERTITMGSTNKPDRPRGSIAQWITAVAAVIVGGVVAATSAWVVSFVGTMAEGGARPVSQAACLAYSSFVLDQHRAGLTTAQIRALLANADRDAARGDSAATAGSVLDDEKACGPVDAVIAAAATN